MESNPEALFSAIRHGYADEVVRILESSNISDYKQSETGSSLLHIACQNGNKKMVKLLLRRGANMNAVNVQGETALHYCFKFNYQNIGEYLVSKGADDSITNVSGLTCYEMMISKV